MSDKYNSARLEILNEVLSFPTIRGKDWLSDWDEKVQIGDLVSMSSAPASVWYLSWVEEIKAGDFTQYLLRSIETNELCWWSNIGLNFYNRETVSQRPSWRWTDSQHKFANRWRKVLYENDAYIVRSGGVSFDGNSVTIKTRIMHGLGDPPPEKTFKNWRKTTIAMMEKYYIDSVKWHDAAIKKPVDHDAGE